MVKTNIKFRWLPLVGLLMIITLTACSGSARDIYTNFSDEGNSLSSEVDDTESDVLMHEFAEMTENLPESTNDADTTISNEIVDDINSSATLLTYEDQTLLRRSIFIGEGPWIVLGGDGLSWYYNVFGEDFYFMPMHIVNLIDSQQFSDWVSQFEWYESGLRDGREWGLRAAIQEFNISMEAIIAAIEEVFDLPMSEIDYLVTWARTVEMPPAVWNDEAWEARRWRSHKSLSDIEALFSNDVNVIWAAFPGFGVLHNNRAYSPEWILNNTERAIYGELIHLSDIQLVIDTAVNDFLFINDITDTAIATHQSALAAYNSPTPIPFQLSFDLGLGAAPSNIPPITVNAWDGIPQALSAHQVEDPTKVEYEFLGWYLDDSFTIQITDTFRMPARNATLYARWERLTDTGVYHNVIFIVEPAIVSITPSPVQIARGGTVEIVVTTQGMPNGAWVDINTVWHAGIYNIGGPRFYIVNNQVTITLAAAANAPLGQDWVGVAVRIADQWGIPVILDDASLVVTVVE